MSRVGELSPSLAHVILGDLEVAVAMLERPLNGHKRPALFALANLLADCYRAGIVPSSGESPSIDSHGPLSEGHAEDARRDRRRAGGLLALGVLHLMVATLVMTSAAFTNTESQDSFWPFVVGVSPLLLGAGASIWQADRLRRSSLEAVRLQRQLLMLEPFLSPFPEAARIIMRAAIAPRIFSRSLDDLDPLRDVRVPVKEVSSSLGVQNLERGGHDESSSPPPSFG